MHGQMDHIALMTSMQVLTAASEQYIFAVKVISHRALQSPGPCSMQYAAFHVRHLHASVCISTLISKSASLPYQKGSSASAVISLCDSSAASKVARIMPTPIAPTSIAERSKLLETMAAPVPGDIGSFDRHAQIAVFDVWPGAGHVARCGELMKHAESAIAITLNIGSCSHDDHNLVCRPNRSRSCSAVDHALEIYPAGILACTISSPDP
jgi:hypothetical protein